MLEVRREAEENIRKRIKRSKLLTGFLTPLAVAAGFVAGATKDANAAAYGGLGVGVGLGAAMVGDSILRRRRALHIIDDYAAAQEMPSGLSRISVTGLVSPKPGSIAAEISVNDASIYPSTTSVFKSIGGGQLGGLIGYWGGERLGDVYTRVDRQILSGEYAEPGAAFVAAGIGGLLIRNAALNSEVEAYFRQLDNIDTSILHTPHARH